jgi:O-antigen/teichoic acid export membrane protein
MEDVGKYQAAYKILNLLRSFWGMGIGTITTPIIMIFKTNNELSKISEIYLKRLLPQLLFITMVVLSIIIVTSDYVLIWIYGSQFKETILPFKILIASHNFTTISFGLLAIARSFDMTKVLLYLGLLAGVMNIALDIFLVPVFGISGASIASLITFAIMPVIFFIYISKRFNVKRELPLLFPLLILCVLAINIFNLDYMIKITGTGICIVLSYVIAKNHKLFLKSDISIFDNIEMPTSVRNLLIRLLNILASK